MIILLLLIVFILLLFMKIRIIAFLTLNNLEYDYSFDIMIYQLKLKKINKADVEKFISQNRKKGKKYKKTSKIIKKIKFEKLFLDMKIGLIEIMPTVFIIPIISIITSTICTLLNMNSEKTRYTIRPAFNELTVQAKFETEITFRIINLIL